MNQINLQKSLEKLVVLGMIQEKVYESNTLSGIALKEAITNMGGSIILTIQDCHKDNPKSMTDLFGEPLMQKILCL